MPEDAGKEVRQEGMTIFVSLLPPFLTILRVFFLTYLPDLLPDTEREIRQNTGEPGQRCVVIALSTLLSIPEKYTVQTVFRAASSSKRHYKVLKLREHWEVSAADPSAGQAPGHCCQPRVRAVSVLVQAAPPVLRATAGATNNFLCSNCSYSNGLAAARGANLFHLSQPGEK